MWLDFSAFLVYRCVTNININNFFNAVSNNFGTILCVFTTFFLTFEKGIKKDLFQIVVFVKRFLKLIYIICFYLQGFRGRTLAMEVRLFKNWKRFNFWTQGKRLGSSMLSICKTFLGILLLNLNNTFTFFVLFLNDKVI